MPIGQNIIDSSGLAPIFRVENADDIGLNAQGPQLRYALFKMAEKGNIVATEIPPVAVFLKGVVHRLVFVEDIILGKDAHAHLVEAGRLQCLQRLLLQGVALVRHRLLP